MQVQHNLVSHEERKRIFTVEARVNEIPYHLTPEIMEILLEYGKLASVLHPSNKEASRLGEILKEAAEDEATSFWIAEIDHILGHSLGLLNNDDRESYQNQQILLKEHMGDRFCPNPNSERWHQITQYLRQMKGNTESKALEGALIIFIALGMQH